MIVTNKGVFYGDLDGARFLEHPVYKAQFCLSAPKLQGVQTSNLTWLITSMG